MRDLLNPPGMFQDGVRVHQWSAKNLLPMSGKLITEFDRRRNIRDMFSRKPSLITAESSDGTFANGSIVDSTPSIMPSPSESVTQQSEVLQTSAVAPSVPVATPAPKNNTSAKRSQKEISQSVAKRAKSGSQPSTTADNKKGQKSLKGFFQQKATSKPSSQSDGLDGTDEERITVLAAETQATLEVDFDVTATTGDQVTSSPTRSQQSDSNSFIDPIVSKESWGKLFIKPTAPKCEHKEPCKTMLTKKTGVNCGRSFWMCARPLGPSGNKEKGTQWRCSTFIWASDWNGGD